MKKITTLILISLFPFIAIAQITIDLYGTVIEDISFSIPKGTSIKLKSIDKNEKGYYKAVVAYNDTEERISIYHIERISFKTTNSKEFWQNQALSYDVYEGIKNNGLQYKLRNELEEDALDYTNYLERNNMIFKDSYLESYLYTLVHKIYPSRINDGRPGNLTLKILKTTIPNAFIFPNGTMFLTTGLLSTLNSEEELLGVLAHEISHYILDHSIKNINEAEERQKRTEFWSAFATGVAVAADAYVAANNEYYAPGAITLGTAGLAYSISSKLNERMGLKYSREQEVEADKCATELLKYINIDPTALSSALLKMKSYSTLTGNYFAISGEGTHPAIDDRIEAIGEPDDIFYSSDYDRTISFVNSFNAINEFNSHHLQACYELVDRNINASVATEDDYILMAMVLTFMHDNDEKNNEALSYIDKAKTLNISPSINIHKQEALVLIRLEKYEDAKTSLNKYLSSLESEHAKLDNIKNPREWSYVNDFIFKEKEWTVKMINKVDKI